MVTLNTHVIFVEKQIRPQQHRIVTDLIVECHFDSGIPIDDIDTSHQFHGRRIVLFAQGFGNQLADLSVVLWRFSAATILRAFCVTKKTF